MLRSSHRWTTPVAASAIALLAGGGGAAAALATAPGARHVAQSQHALRLVPAASAAAAARGATIREMETSLTIAPGADDGGAGRCPRSAPHAISGFWGTDDLPRTKDLVVVRSTPVGRGTRAWEVGLKNTSTTPVTAYVGIVCLK
jgi:hypothetical protein